jgi:glycine/D-amino acid oxidase-like deaminating enzyme
MKRVTAAAATIGGAAYIIVFQRIKAATASRDAPPPPALRPLQHVVVIGAGVVGLTTAHYLAMKGVRVTVVDSAVDVARGASFKNGSLLCPSLPAPWTNASMPSKLWGSLTQEGSAVKIHVDAWRSPTFWRWALHAVKHNGSAAGTADAARRTYALAQVGFCFLWMVVGACCTRSPGSHLSV